MQEIWKGLYARMKQHHTECNAAINLTTDVSNQPNTPLPDIVNFEREGTCDFTDQTRFSKETQTCCV